MKFLEQKGYGQSDYKKTMIGQRHQVRNAMNQLRQVIRDLTNHLDEAPTAAEILDLDRQSGMRTETVRVDPQAWRKLPQFLVKLCVENRYLWDFLKFETMRQELDANISNQHRWVLYDNKEVP